MNHAKFRVIGIKKKIGKDQQKVVEILSLRYLPEKGDPLFDDLPTEILAIGKEYHVKFTPVKEGPVPEFNKAK